MYCTQRTVLQSSLYCDQKNIHRSILSSRTNKYQRESFISIHPVGVYILFLYHGTAQVRPFAQRTTTQQGRPSGPPQPFVLD